MKKGLLLKHHYFTLRRQSRLSLDLEVFYQVSMRLHVRTDSSLSLSPPRTSRKRLPLDSHTMSKRTSTGVQQLKKLQTQLNSLIDDFCDSDSPLPALDEVGPSAPLDGQHPKLAQISAVLGETRALVEGRRHVVFKAFEVRSLSVIASGQLLTSVCKLSITSSAACGWQ